MTRYQHSLALDPAPPELPAEPARPISLTISERALMEALRAPLSMGRGPRDGRRLDAKAAAPYCRLAGMGLVRMPPCDGGTMAHVQLTPAGVLALDGTE